MKMSGRTLALVLAMALLLPVTIVLAAQSGVEFALFWDTVDGGGGTRRGRHEWWKLRTDRRVH